jgi:limonene 1,2-monooxygenase
MGIDPVEQRRMMEESLDAILALLRSEEPVSRQTDWFTMREARLQMRPFTRPHFEVAVAAMVSPSGPRLAGKHGVSLLSLSMSVAEGFAAIGQAWGVAEDQAAAAGRPAPDRDDWRVLGIMHIAETRDEAVNDCVHGLEDFANYFGGGAGFVPLANTVEGAPTSPREFVEAYARSDGVVIGTPDDAIAYIEGLLEQSGGFGAFLLLGHDWADAEATMRSYRLFAREVIPHFKGRFAAPRTSHEWATRKRGEIFGRAGQAILNSITSHVEEKASGVGSNGDEEPAPTAGERA